MLSFARIWRGSRRRAARDGFDLIVLDPPYADPDAGAVLARAGAWLAAGGLLVLEHARRRPAPLVAGPLTADPDGVSPVTAPCRSTSRPPPPLPAGGDTTPS